MAKLDYLDYQQHITLLDGLEDIAPYFVTLPKASPLKEFVNYGLPKEEQFFKREHIPTKVRNLDIKFNSGQLTIDEVISICEKDDDISSFIESQWHKRFNGIFILIYGVPTYITAQHWYYLNYHRLDTGKYADFRTTDRDYWYWRKFCVWDDPKVYGGINFTNRREGKSMKAGAEAEEIATRRRNSMVGIQSKTDGDAKSFFRKFIVRQFRKLPFYFKPIYDGNKNPVNELKFEWGRSAGESLIEPLETIIDYRSSVPVAYDGEKLIFYIMDEAGKFLNCNPVDTWDKVKYCLIEQDRIIGKAIITTTVEEMEKGGGKAFKELWDESSRITHHKKINNLGQTNSGLIPYFTPAYKGFIFDQYGTPIEKDPLPHQQAHRYKELLAAKEKPDEALRMSKMGAIELLSHMEKTKSTEKDRQDFRRKFPNSIKQAFISAFRSCHFSIEKINAALEKYLYTNRDGNMMENHPYNMIQGNFQWRNSIRDSEVEFVPSKSGRWFMSYLLPQSEANKFEYRNGIKIPLNSMKGVVGCDTYGFSILSDTNNKPSLGAAYVYWNFDPSIDGEEKEEKDYVTDDIIVEYLNRPASRDLFNEDMIMMCAYLGLKIFIETNRDHTINYFYDRGYEGYLVFPRKIKKDGSRMIVVESEKAGAYSSANTKYKDGMFAHAEWYVNSRLHRCKFPRLIESIRDVEYDNTQPYDAFMGFGYCLYASRMVNKKLIPRKTGYSSPIATYEVNQN
jgi:hypothetical protein